MQADNKNSEQYPPNLVDQGWLEMQALLDQEMPVESKKRRWAIWWWLLLGILIGAGATYYWSTNTPRALQPIEIKETPVATLDSNNPPDNTIIKDNNNSDINNNSKSNTQPPSTSSKGKMDDEMNDSKLNQTTLAAAEKQTIETKAIAEIDENPIKAESTTPLIESKKYPIIPINPLSSSSIKPIFYSSHPVAIDKLSQQKNSRLAYSISVGMTRFLSNTDYLNGGAFLTYRFSNRWKIGAGLQYLNNINSSDDESLTMTEDNIRIDQTETFSFGTANLSAQHPNQLLLLPINVHYQIKNRLNVFSGITAYLPLGATTESTATVTDASSVFSPEPVIDNTINNNLLWRVGAAYQLSPKLGISFDYSNSFDDAELQLFSFHLRYYLKQ